MRLFPHSRPTGILKCVGAFTLAILVSAALSRPASADLGLNPGDILISNHGGNNVQRLQPDGTITTLTSVSSTPIGLAFDTAFNLYINSDTGIFKLDKDTLTVSPFFTGVGQREGLTFDPTTNHLFSVSFGNNAIEEVDLAGNLVRTITIPGTSALLGISARGGKLLVSDFGTGQIFTGTTTGSSFDLVGSLTPSNTYAVDIDATGNIYANDFSLGKTVKFTPSGGGFTPSDFITGLSEPDNGLSIGDDGSFTISEFGASAVSVWNSDGTLRHRFTGVSDPDELVVFAPIRQGGGNVPEPGTVTLLGSSLVLIGLYGGRRFRARK